MKSYNKLAMIIVQLPLCLGNTHKVFMEEWGKLVPTYFTAWHLKASFHLCALTCKDAPHCKGTQEAQMHNFSNSETSGHF